MCPLKRLGPGLVSAVLHNLLTMPLGPRVVLTSSAIATAPTNAACALHIRSTGRSQAGTGRGRRKRPRDRPRETAHPTCSSTASNKHPSNTMQTHQAGILPSILLRALRHNALRWLSHHLQHGDRGTGPQHKLDHCG